MKIAPRRRFLKADSHKSTYPIVGLSRFDMTVRTVLNCWSPSGGWFGCVTWRPAGPPSALRGIPK